MNVEISLCSHRLIRPTPWRVCRFPMRFEGSFLVRDDSCAALYRCGEIETAGSHMLVRQNGRIDIDESAQIEEFLADLAAYPVFVRGDTFEERLALNTAANERQIPHTYFANGLGFRSTTDAVLAKLTM